MYLRYVALKPTLCTTCIHLEAPNASKCMHVVHSVGLRILLVLERHILYGIGYVLYETPTIFEIIFCYVCGLDFIFSTPCQKRQWK